MLRGLHLEHRGAFEYDWRTRFQMSLKSIGQGMSWAEALRLTQILMEDPASQIAAATAGWQYPLSREGLAIRDLYDLQHRSKSRKKPKPYPRPWDTKPKRMGTAMTVAEYEAIKAGMATVGGQPRDARGRFTKV